MAPKKSKYCTICRGEGDLFWCAQCRRGFHNDCIKLRRKQNEDWVCDDCKTEIVNTERETKTLERFKRVNAMHSQILKVRAEYIRKNRNFLEPFCGQDTLNRLSKVPGKKTTLKKEDYLLESSPEYISEVKLRNYQLQGVSKLINWFFRGIGGILGDEMGLGKTIQTITMISVLKHEYGLSGPHLIVTPLAVLQNWANEFRRFAPDILVKKIYGCSSERNYILNQDSVYHGQFEVYLTTYETVISEEAFFTDCKWNWCTIVVDEAHKMKQDGSIFRNALVRFKCPFRLLLTGTPLQNNLTELWSLLNYIIPEIFGASTVFKNAVEITSNKVDHAICLQARSLLENCFMLRRTKDQVETSLLPKLIYTVYVPLTEVQTRWYKSLLQKNNDNDENGNNSSTNHHKSLLTSMQLMHIISQLVKVINHPKQILLKQEQARKLESTRILKNYYHGAEFAKPKMELLAPAYGTAKYILEEELQAQIGEKLVAASGKLRILDRLLLKLKSENSRVLLFSQYVETLDVIQEYLTFRFGPLGVSFLRLDGSTNKVFREIDMRTFNAPESSIFLYLISTKAGGQGINLATADTVILYDSSWNPQVDLQAQDRAHRIGQKKQVKVFRLVTKDTLEERLLQMAERKMILDHIVIAKNSTNANNDTDNKRKGKKRNQRGQNTDNSIPNNVLVDDSREFSITELWDILRFGADKIFSSKHQTSLANLDISSSESVDRYLEECISPNDMSVIKDVAKSDITMDDEMTNESEEVKKSNRLDDGRVAKEETLDVSFSSSTQSPATSDWKNETDETDGFIIPGQSTIFDCAKTSISKFKNEESSIIISSEALEGNKESNDEDIDIKDMDVDAGATNGNADNDGNETVKNEMEKESEDAKDENDSFPRYKSQRKKFSRNLYVPATVFNDVQKRTRKRVHEDYCFSCDDGGELIECRMCPKVFHPECVQLDKVPKSPWICPWHSCCECDRSSSNTGGVQFKCLFCPIAYCFDCFPKDIDMKRITPPAGFVKNFEVRGFVAPQNAAYFVCGDCRDEGKSEKTEVIITYAPNISNNDNESKSNKSDFPDREEMRKKKKIASKQSVSSTYSNSDLFGGTAHKQTKMSTSSCSIPSYHDSYNYNDNGSSSRMQQVFDSTAMTYRHMNNPNLYRPVSTHRPYEIALKEMSFNKYLQSGYNSSYSKFVEELNNLHKMKNSEIIINGLASPEILSKIEITTRAVHSLQSKLQSLRAEQSNLDIELLSFTQNMMPHMSHMPGNVQMTSSNIIDATTNAPLYLSGAPLLPIIHNMP